MGCNEHTIFHVIATTPVTPTNKHPQQLCVPGNKAGSIDKLFFGYTRDLEYMDGWVFNKLARDCKLLGKKCTSTDVDLIFAKVS